MADEQERAEQRDETVLGKDYPPEEPLGVDEYGTTPAEERVDEPLEERIRRESTDLDPLATEVTEPDALVAEPEGTRAAVRSAAEVPDADPQRAADDLEGTGQEPAEQAALHIEDDTAR